MTPFLVLGTVVVGLLAWINDCVHRIEKKAENLERIADLLESIDNRLADKSP